MNQFSPGRYTEVTGTTLARSRGSFHFHLEPAGLTRAQVGSQKLTWIETQRPCHSYKFHHVHSALAQLILGHEGLGALQPRSQFRLR